MKTYKQKKSPKKAIILSCVAAVVIAGSLVGIYALNHQSSTPKPSTSTSTINYSSATIAQKAAAATTKATAATTDNGSTTNSTPTTTSSGQKTSVTVTIPVANNSQITSQIGADTSTGTCTLTLSKSGETSVVLTAGVQAQAETSTCEGFKVPSDLSAGTWQVNLHFENDTLTGDATPTTITVD